MSPASRQALLGLRALALSKGGFALASDAARDAALPAGSLAKVFQRLARRGLLLSRRGPGGGYALARPASRIRLSDVLNAVQDIAPGGRRCLLGNRFCGERKTYCPIHRVINKADSFLLEGFQELTLEDLAGSAGWT